MIGTAAVAAGIASSRVFSGVHLFWYAWAAHVAVFVFYLARRGVLIRQGRAGIFGKIDRLALGGFRLLGFTSALLLFFRR
ncbi:hypothetical protein [Corallococcus sp. AB038B]|uniref:hypothetical protein n=1 Tax=Corallococcus sp. AB038B TaxID=2316718 RepID=UPI00131570BC|nr:hypothetical protein [Corallococcus sp. AB038B]